MNYKTTSIKTMMLGAIALSIFAVSCKKDTQETSTADATAVEKLFDQLDPEMQSFTIDPSQPNTINGKDGMVINIPANAFVDANGNAVNGQVTVSLKEILSLKDQILTGIEASSNGKLLASGGEFFFEVTAKGEKLNLAVNQSITFDIPADKVDSTMQVFVGNNGTDTAFDWVLADSSNYTTVVTDSAWNPKDSVWAIDSSYIPSYEMYCATEKYTMKVYNIYNTSYYNCDHFISYPNYSSTKDCQINVASGNEKETIDYSIKVVYKQFGTVAEAYTGNYLKVINESLKTNFYGTWLTGEEVTVLVIGVGQKSKKTYFGKTTLTLTEGAVPNISISTVSNDELLTALDNL